MAASKSKSTQAEASYNKADFAKLIEIGIALSAERDHHRLMERILLETKAMCNADGGTLYLRGNLDTVFDREGVPSEVFSPTPDGALLKFEIMRTDSLGIAKGGTTGKDIPFPPLPLYASGSGAPNHDIVAAHAALTGKTINIPDAYQTTQFDFSGPRSFDEATGYRSQSFLNVPLKNHQGKVIGVLQLINAQSPDGACTIAFPTAIQPLIEALASQAAVALDNRLLLCAQRRLLDAFIQVIGGAIDAKSPYTGGHCQRVPELAKMIARAAHESSAPPFENFTMTEDDWYELHLASWLHDCGKVVTPEYVVDKATKLETIYDRIHEIRMRFEVMKRDAEIDFLKKSANGGDVDALRQKCDDELRRLDEDFAFIAECNVGGEFMAAEKITRLEAIAKRTWMRTLDDRLGVSHEELRRMERTAPAPLPAREYLLADKVEHIFPRRDGDIVGTDNPFGFRMTSPENEYNRGEIYNLSIPKGTLTPEDRHIINNHAVQTIVMLEQMPFPNHLKRIPEYAGAHHETMLGTGYPRGLKKEEMSLPARIMAVADIFEALTAADRPYKKAKTLSESLKILSFMNKDEHIDPDLFSLFIEKRVYQDYADKFLNPEQIDAVDPDDYLDTSET
ncbi:HD family phosphohydrolase [Varunaivibrio sulfuroxidans]|uniref:HD-GYP domain-containing protein (C-di-GMP phosphodiesterase class II) n=1 Tax=Varunaivibrio sulfuroxidans TaxID=1773489 RepID=A0A4R3J5P4_9PROT|nr:HD family phosphohydrolase [Varunaivibrio sulfuroxidans]TCS60647.1 HD-GYP domain-containing protein (c-di-GMP phosphodiesterase class II) [Varunaivibrio sulfuroxidans]WES30136.1 HD domain-containing phosphohydrolase [Varunaivibrio sulfuroxidans]